MITDQVCRFLDWVADSELRSGVFSVVFAALVAAALALLVTAVWYIPGEDGWW